ncbi:MAG: hypothetical protein ACXABY_16460, partial [Candidatus Thorarchaeota archaeon]
MKYNQITTAHKNSTTRALYSSERRRFSNLSFYIHCCLGGCTEDSLSFSGKKLTQKQWKKTAQWKKDWFVMRLLRTSSKKSGLSHKDRERLYIATRTAQADHWRQRLDKSRCTNEQKEAALGLLKRVERVGFNTIVGGSRKTADKLRDAISRACRDSRNRSLNSLLDS